MDRIFEQITVIAVAIIGVAILAVIVSKNANTAGVIAAASKGFATALGAATAPVTGQSFGTFGISPGYGGGFNQF
jgi:hypothetical protein